MYLHPLESGYVKANYTDDQQQNDLAYDYLLVENSLSPQVTNKRKNHLRAVFLFVDETKAMNIDEYRIATTGDALELAGLINNSYRPSSPDVGWTHESDLIEGERINEKQFRELLNAEGSTVLIGLNKGEIVACVNINEESGAIYIAMLTVKPSLQNLGLGKEMLQLSEEYAKNQYEPESINLFVISERKSLYDFYLRRGYRPTEIAIDYPVNAGVGIPKVNGLKLALLTKEIA